GRAARQRHARELRLRDEIGGEFRGNAVPLAEHSNFLIDLRGPAHAALFSAEIAYALRRPESRHERILSLPVGKVDIRGPVNRSTAAIALDGHVRRAMARVARQHDQVTIGEHVARLRGEGARETNVAVDPNADVRENGIDEPAGDDSYRALDGFVGPHEV